jgi:hypothetical protein
MKAQTVDVKESTGRILCCTTFRTGKKLLGKGHLVSKEDACMLDMAWVPTRNRAIVLPKECDW